MRRGFRREDFSFVGVRWPPRSAHKVRLAVVVTPSLSCVTSMSKWCYSGPHDTRSYGRGGCSLERRPAGYRRTYHSLVRAPSAPARLLRPRRAFQPHPPGGQPFGVDTHAVVIRNAGRATAHNVRVPHWGLLEGNVPPISVSVFPPVTTTREVTEGRETLVIPVLAPGQQVTLSYLYFPPITFNVIHIPISSDEVMARQLNVLPTPQPAMVGPDALGVGADRGGGSALRADRTVSLDGRPDTVRRRFGTARGEGGSHQHAMARRPEPRAMRGAQALARASLTCRRPSPQPMDNARAGEGYDEILSRGQTLL